MRYADWPVYCREGHRAGYKIFIGDLPRDLDQDGLDWWLARLDGVVDTNLRARQVGGPWAIVTCVSAEAADIVHDTVADWTWIEPGFERPRWAAVRFVTFE